MARQRTFNNLDHAAAEDALRNHCSGRCSLREASGKAATQLAGGTTIFWSPGLFFQIGSVTPLKHSRAGVLCVLHTLEKCFKKPILLFRTNSRTAPMRESVTLRRVGSLGTCPAGKHFHYSMFIKQLRVGSYNLRSSLRSQQPEGSPQPPTRTGAFLCPLDQKAFVAGINHPHPENLEFWELLC